MRKAGIQRALNELIQDRQDLRAGNKSVSQEAPNSEDAALSMDVSRIRVMSGLNVLAESLIKALSERSVFGPCDVHVEQPIHPEIQPELHAAGAANISFQARLSVLEDLPRFHADVGYQIRYMFNAVQNDELYADLFPEPGRTPKGILFPFHREDGSDETGYYYLLEHVPCGKFLRLTLESGMDSRLRLMRIPHRPVDRIDIVHTRVDIPGSATVCAQGIMDACSRQSLKYTASPMQMEKYFQFLRLSGLTRIETMFFVWQTPFARDVLSSPRKRLWTSAARILFALGNSSVVACLLSGGTVRLDEGERSCYLDLSQKNRCLGISFGHPRTKAGLPECLARMPAVAETSKAHPEAFRGTRVLLVHHLTGEVLGLLQAMADMGAVYVDTLWVKYAGEVEPSYREIILSLPETMFRFRGVTPVPQLDGVQNQFLLSEDYSPVDDMSPLMECLRRKPHGFFDAMRKTAGHMFFQAALEAESRRERLVLVEDGGYLAPALHRLCLENRTVGEAASSFGIPLSVLPEASCEMRFAEWLRGTFVGSVEHTRNGYEALKEVVTEQGSLAFPSLTIAVSDFKVHGESRDVAYSCLHAVESIMNGMGFALADRVALVLGASGAIGRKTMRILESRLGVGNLYGVDIVEPMDVPAWTFVGTPEELSDEAISKIDLVFGVTGKSILNSEWIERLLATTCRRHVFFASGSTKTAEFSQLSEWLARRSDDCRTCSDRATLRLALAELLDPKSGAKQGRSAKIEFGGKTVFFHLLADLMPVNFLYYGVPAETMNRVMNELLRMTVALARGNEGGEAYPCQLLALDRDIDADGKLIGRRGHGDSI